MPEVMKYSVCAGGRKAVALKEQNQAIYKFFSMFTHPKVIPDEETYGLTEEQIKSIYKESAGYFTTGQATQRKNALMPTATMFVIDGDISVDDKDLCKLETVHHTLTQRKIIHCIHSSFSPGRWRLIIPLDTEIMAEELVGLTKAFVSELQELGFNIAWVKENGIISQPWFKPVIVNDGQYVVKKNLVGNKLDPLDYVYGESGGEKRKKFDKEEALKKILGGEELHHTTNSMIMSMISYGFSAIDVQNAVQGMLLSAKHEFLERNDYSRSKDIDDRIKDLPRSITGALEKIDGKKFTLPDIPKKEQDARTLTMPPGVIGELADLMLEKSIYPVKEVCIVAAFGLVAGIGGRTYNVHRSGINLYLTLLMRTGMGKDAIQKFIGQVLAQYKHEGQSFLGAKTYTSGKGLAEDLRTARSRLCVFTEAGFMYKTSSGNTESLQRNILDYFSKSGMNDLAMPERYSDGNNSIAEIKAPSLTIINESTPEIFNKTMLQRDAANTGERARMLAFNVMKKKPHINPNHDALILTKSLRNQFDTFFKLCRGNQQKDLPDVIDIKPFASYNDIINSYVDRENKAWDNNSKLEATCLTRVGEKLNRVTGCMAAIENPGTPVITQEIVDWALSLIEYELATVYNFVGAESEGNFYRDLVAPIIVQLLKNEGPRTTHNLKMHKKNRFSLSHLNIMLGQRREVAQYLGTECRALHTLEIVRYFVDLGYMHEPRAIGGQRKICEVTHGFLELFDTEIDS